jgi:FkbM family methyltransferase
MLLDLNFLIKKYDLKIKGVIHIGAHYGEENETYINNSISNLIYFEPLRKNFEILKQNVGEKTIIHNIALGNEEKEIKMYVESKNKGQSSSILKPSIHLKQYPHIVFDEEEIVSMNKLDNISFDREYFNMINIDVQGYELEVFKGGVNTLETVDYIMTEVNRAEVYENCPLIEELDDFLNKFNFTRVETTWDGVTWGDALYIKK